MVSCSIVICTHNRVGIVGSAIRHALAEARSVGGEVLVIDNASSDGTSAVVGDLACAEGPELRVVQEPRLGLSAARNRGLADARGTIGVFLDDDAIPRLGWLRAILEPYRNPEVACVGGRVVLQFPMNPPEWLTPSLHSALSAFDLGDQPRRLRDRPGDEYPYGANISVRIETATRLGGFSEWVGPRGNVQLVHDETDLCYRLDRAGATICYAPEAIVDHVVLPERISPRWFLDRHWGRGQSSAIFELRNRGVRKALGRIRWHYGKHLRVRGYDPVDPVDPECFAAECRRREALGYVAGVSRWVIPLGFRRAARKESQQGSLAVSAPRRPGPGS